MHYKITQNKQYFAHLLLKLGDLKLILLNFGGLKY